MHTEHPILDNSSQRQVIKHISAVPPHIERRVLPETLIIETIHLSDLSTLMVPSNQSDTVGISDLVG